MKQIIGLVHTRNSYFTTYMPNCTIIVLFSSKPSVIKLGHPDLIMVSQWLNWVAV